MRAERQQDRLREQQAGHRPERVGHRRRRRRLDPGLRDRHQRQRRAADRLQDRHRRLGVHHHDLPDRLLRRRRRPPDRHGHAVGDAAAAPAAVHHRRHHRALRLRQLGRLGVLERARRRPSRASTSRGSTAPTAATPATSRSSSATTPAHSDVVFQTSDPTWQAYNTYGGSDFYHGGDQRPRLQGQLQPSVRSPAAAPAAATSSSPTSTRWSASWSATATTSATSPASTPTAAARCSRTTRSSCRSATTSTGASAQRANVEAARDAGVNLQFLSGNEVYWRPATRRRPTPATRRTAPWSPTRRPGRNAKIDPSAEWTGTWRDPRFAPKSQGGGVPENALTGTMYMVQLRRPARHRERRRGQDPAVAQHRRSPSMAAGTAHRWRRTPSATSPTRTSTTAPDPPA